MTNVTNDAVDIEVTRRYPTGNGNSIVGKRNDVAVGALQHIGWRNVHDARETGVRVHVAVLTVHRYKALGPNDRQQHLQVIGLSVARGMHVGDTRMHDFAARLQETIDHSVDVVLIARNRIRGKDDDVVFAHLQPLAVTSGHQRKRRHWLTLRASRDDAQVLGPVIPDRLDVDQLVVVNVEETKFAGQPHVLAHRHTKRADDPSIRNRGVGNLLDAMNMTCEAGGDDPLTLLFRKYLAKHHPNTFLTRGVTVFFGVGGVAEQKAHTFDR